MAIPKGFIPRIEAQDVYQRSKQSFIRDVDNARQRGDSAFLKNFLVALSDGSTIDGEKATKKVLRDNDSMRPEWYIRRSFLETRYWTKGKKKKNGQKKTTGPVNAGAKEPSSQEKSSSSSERQYVELLEKTNADLRAQNDRQLELIGKLTENQEQSNVLVKSLTDLLKTGELPSGETPSNAEGLEQAPVIDVVDATPVSNESNPKASPSIWQKDLFWFINNRFR